MQQTKTWEQERKDHKQAYKERGKLLREKKATANAKKTNEKGETWVEGFGRVSM